ncbi:MULTISPECIES: tetratricopeptide repeat protein [unclassified Streptomyces]|uniref:tetratricopeptide repeat protein n=1 Tax=unclassified Streptomyces TaxID=2593676 RepID=UPI0035DC0F25
MFFPRRRGHGHPLFADGPIRVPVPVRAGPARVPAPDAAAHWSPPSPGGRSCRRQEMLVHGRPGAGIREAFLERDVLVGPDRTQPGQLFDPSRVQASGFVGFALVGEPGPEREPGRHPVIRGDVVVRHPQLPCPGLLHVPRGSPHCRARRDQHAWSLGAAGERAEAARLMAEVAADRARVLGADHPDTLQSRYQHAWNLGQAGEG